jgi:hypothetical protein
MGIHKFEPDIYIGFSPALQLQCVTEILAQGNGKNNLVNRWILERLQHKTEHYTLLLILDRAHGWAVSNTEHA